MSTVVRLYCHPMVKKCVSTSVRNEVLLLYSLTYNAWAHHPGEPKNTNFPKLKSFPRLIRLLHLIRLGVLIGGTGNVFTAFCLFFLENFNLEVIC
jgi:hypothetical protein